MRGSVGGRSGRRWEERGLGAGLVGRLVHLVLDVGRLPDRIGELDDEVVVQVVLIWGYGLFSNSRTNDLAFDAVSAIRCSCRRWDCW